MDFKNDFNNLVSNIDALKQLFKNKYIGKRITINWNNGLIENGTIQSVHFENEVFDKNIIKVTMDNDSVPTVIPLDILFGTTYEIFE